MNETQEAVQEATKQVTMLLNEHEKLNTELKDKTDNFHLISSSLQDKITSLNNGLTNKKEEQEKLENDIAHVTEELNQTTNRYEELAKLKEQFKYRLDSVTSQSQKQELDFASQISSLEQSYQETESNVKQLLLKLSNLQQEFQIKESKLEELKIEQEKLQLSIDQSKQQYDTDSAKYVKIQEIS